MAPGNGSAYHAGGGGGRSKAVVAAKMPSRRDTPGGGGGGGGMEQERAVQDPGLKDYVGLFSRLPVCGGPWAAVRVVWSGVAFSVSGGSACPLVYGLSRPWHLNFLCRPVELSLWRGRTCMEYEN
jgi:hypothetical protein